MTTFNAISWVRFIYWNPVYVGEVIIGHWWPQDIGSEILFDSLVSNGLLIDCEVI